MKCAKGTRRIVLGGCADVHARGRCAVVMLVMILKDQEQRPTRQVVERAHPSQHEARNDLQTVDRRFFQTNGKFLRLDKNILLQDLERQTPDRRDQSAECMQILMPIDNATRCPTKAGRLVIVKVPGTRNWGTGSVAKTIVVVASVHRCWV